MKIFYHLDLDGKAAGAIVLRWATRYDKYPMECIEINYGMAFPFDRIREGEQVWIVDYSISPEEMDKLFTITNDIIWIDHHKSAIQRYDDYPRNIDGIRYDGISGCMLTWAYVKHIANTPAHKPKPEFVPCMCSDAPMPIKYIGDYDVWRFEYGEDTKDFHFYLEVFSNEILLPKGNVWDMLFRTNWDNSAIDYCLNIGRQVRSYRENMMGQYIKSYGFETELLGYYKCFAINMGMISSDDFISIDANNYDILIGFCTDGKQWRYSLRSNTVDVSLVAMQFGGGGHKGAAGFASADFVL